MGNVFGEAMRFVTGDDDLLTLDSFRGIAIITPADFLRFPPEWKRGYDEYGHDRAGRQYLELGVAQAGGITTEKETMGTYKGNAGHLMQHWTLCELLAAAKRRHTLGLNFIDAQAMAPLATVRKGKNKRFDVLKARLQEGVANSNLTYEYAWQHLEPNEGYPNSAAFVWKIWEDQVHMLLCETDQRTVTDLKAWAQGNEGYPNSAAFVWKIWEDQVHMLLCETDQRTVTDLKAWAQGFWGSAVVKIAEGDWRKTFKKGLPTLSDVRLPDGSLTLVSFDPDRYDRGQLDPWNSRRLYPEDLELTLCALDNAKGGVLIQLSTYSNKNNPQEDVISSTDEILIGGGFTRAAKVRLNRKMMSLVYARGVSWSDELADLPGRFGEWLNGIDKQLPPSQ